MSRKLNRWSSSGCWTPGATKAGLTRRYHLQGISKEPEVITEVGRTEGAITDVDGKCQSITFGEVGYPNTSPMHLLATSALINNGAVVHLKRGNCYLQLRRKNGTRATHIPIEEVNGLYVLHLEHVVKHSDIHEAYTAELSHRPQDQHELGQWLQAATMDLWHQRLNHADKATLRVMYDRGVAEGWKLPRGKYTHNSKCSCDACRIAGASASATPNQRRFNARYQSPYASVQ